MPWNPKDASRFTKKAKTPKAKRQFAKVANNILERTGDEGRAIKGANAAVKKRARNRRLAKAKL